MKRVLYTNVDGWTFMVAVPDSEPDYELGLVIGPPDLSSLDLKESKTKELNNRLAKRKLIELRDIEKNPSVLYNIVTGMGFEREVVRRIKGIYQGVLNGKQNG